MTKQLSRELDIKYLIAAQLFEKAQQMILPYMDLLDDSTQCKVVEVFSDVGIALTLEYERRRNANVTNPIP